MLGLAFSLLVFRGQKSLSLTFLASLALPLGMGISSIVFFMLNLLGINVFLILCIEVALLLGLVFKLKLKDIQPFRVFAEKRQNKGLIHLLLTNVFFYSWIITAAVFFFNSIQNPHGLWDAWADWNLGARFISRAPYEWHGLFQQLKWNFHTNYPLLQKAFIARCWLLTGSETVWIPIGFSFIIAFCTIGLLTSSISVFTSRINGLIAGLILLCSPFYMVMAYSQYADNTVGYFYLATVILLIYARHNPDVKSQVLFLAGATAGFTAWSKNEGLFFIVSLFVSQLTLLFYKKSFRELLSEFKDLFLGLFPVLAVVLFFKFQIAPTNEIVSAQGARTMEKLTDISRYQIAFDWYWLRIGNFGGWFMNPWWLFFIGALLNIENLKKNIHVIVPYFTLIIMMLSGGFFVFIIADLDIVSYLSSTVHRLYFQLFPTFLLIYFIAIGKQIQKK